MKMLLTVHLDLEHNRVCVAKVADELEAFYQVLNVDMIELPIRSICGKEYAIMCDEEGLLKDNPIISCMNCSGPEYAICGNVMIFNEGEDGELESLTLADIDMIEKRIKLVPDERHPAGIHPVLILDD